MARRCTLFDLRREFRFAEGNQPGSNFGKDDFSNVTASNTTNPLDNAQRRPPPPLERTASHLNRQEAATIGEGRLHSNGQAGLMRVSKETTCPIPDMDTHTHTHHKAFCYRRASSTTTSTQQGNERRTSRGKSRARSQVRQPLPQLRGISTTWPTEWIFFHHAGKRERGGRGEEGEGLTVA